LVTAVFWIFTIFAVLGGLGVIGFRQPIQNVLSLVAVMISLAVLFLLLSAQFVFVVQVIVYAGAVMVLFLFVVALLGPIKEEPRRSPIVAVITAVVVVAAFAGFLYAMLSSVTYRAPDSGTDLNLFGTVQSIGIGLFTTYLYPFELTSVLLLVAAVGAIYLSRRTPDEPLDEAAEREPETR
jgi:NADH-quinone oxidoreductase subunit J